MSLTDVRWIDLPHVPDERGVLTSIESGPDVPFEIRRVFFMRHVRGERGGHAHRATRQLLVAIAGVFSVEVSDVENIDCHELAALARDLYRETKPAERPMVKLGFTHEAETEGRSR